MLFTKARVLEAAAQRTASSTTSFRHDSASRSEREAFAKAKPTDTFDIFLSHARVDANVVLGSKVELERFGFNVYVDWLDDPQLDRTKVDAATATTLRARMSQCRGLLYVHSTNAPESKWMPWELGYFDGLLHKAAILPVVESSANKFNGSEYLGIYPYLSDDRSNSKSVLFVNDPNDANMYVPLRQWLDGAALTKHT